MNELIAACRASQRQGRPGITPAGGVRSIAPAASYLILADRFTGPEWADARHFRFGASSLPASLLQIPGHSSPRPDSGY